MGTCGRKGRGNHRRLRLAVNSKNAWMIHAARSPLPAVVVGAGGIDEKCSERAVWQIGGCGIAGHQLPGPHSAQVEICVCTAATGYRIALIKRLNALSASNGYPERVAFGPGSSARRHPTVPLDLDRPPVAFGLPGAAAVDPDRLATSAAFIQRIAA